MSAAPNGPESLPIPLAPRVEEAGRLAHGVLLVRTGYSYRQAAAQVGVDHTTLWRAVQRAETGEGGWGAEEGADRRTAVKAAVTAEMGIERMMREIDTVPPQYVAGWTLAAARMAGLIDVVRDGSTAGGGSVLAQILDTLGEGGRLQVGVQVDRTSPARPQTNTIRTVSEVLGANSPPAEAPSHTPTHGEGEPGNG